MNKNTAIIGCGNMGSAIYKGMTTKFAQNNIYVCDNNKEKLKKLKIKKFSTQATNILEKCDTIILAIKPQSFEFFAKENKNLLKNKLIVSVMAGISIKNINLKTGSKQIIRGMPNLPAAVGMGVIGWVASKKVSVAQKKSAVKIFESFGKQLEVKKEKMIDSLTALSGSGPAYFFYLCELISNVAKKMGFNSEHSKMLAEQTFVGSALLLQSGNMSAKEWKNAVTSKKGTTEAALKKMKEKKLPIIIQAAIKSAQKKAEQLNR